ncbi:thiol-disulfide oxidoreductase DCC family protein [Alteromonas sp. CYL-A6]|uniref:thiol-disulfide oxidoreductase DCC family protein n=1 Tax=Alteromonas nitratireducens TaxID=3390813 RepID=UPI0034AC084E
MYIFFDGHCPLCRAEMRHLRKRDHSNVLTMVDIQSERFSEDFPGLDWDALNNRIHVQLDDGTLVSGLDATHAAWKAVGVGWLYAPLRWPLIRPVADWFYTIFAKHRYTISYWLTGQKRGCETCEIATGQKPSGSDKRGTS